MKKNVIGYCPICKEKLFVKTLKCEHCETEIGGEFEMTPFAYLTKEQLEFALIFIKNEGNIKMIEKTLGISYPTVKKSVEDLNRALGFHNIVEKDTQLDRETIREKLKAGEISIEEAEKLLGDL